MRLYLVRHGEALPASADPERPLSAAGLAAVGRLADWARANDVAPVEIRHSGILRAAQTAEILAARLDPAGGLRAVPGLAPDDPPGPLAGDLVHEAADLMLVTHLPLVGELATHLLRGAAPGFDTATMACLVRDDGHWSLAWVVSAESLI